MVIHFNGLQARASTERQVLDDPSETAAASRCQVGWQRTKTPGGRPGPVRRHEPNRAGAGTAEVEPDRVQGRDGPADGFQERFLEGPEVEEPSGAPASASASICVTLRRQVTSGDAPDPSVGHALDVDPHIRPSPRYSDEAGVGPG